MRLTKINPAEVTHLRDGDECFHIGSYVSRRTGAQAGITNQQIRNLKKKPASSSEQEMYYKGKAVNYWAAELRKHLNIQRCIEEVTFIVTPCSKSKSHPDYDDRLLQVLRKVSPALDVRDMVNQTADREGQHDGGRLSPHEIAAQLSVNEAAFFQPVKPTVVIFDDVITMGASFRAMKNTLKAHRMLQDANIVGLFLARTVWEQEEFIPDFLDAPAPRAR